MSHPWIRAASLTVLVAGIGGRAFDSPAPAPPQRIHGITLSTHTDGSDWGATTLAETLADIRAVGADWVAIHPYAGIRGDGSVRFRPLRGHDLPEYLSRPIREARRQGMKLLLKPHIAYWGSPFSWRGDVKFDSPKAWDHFWESYTAWIVSLARACPDVDALVVGTELDRTLGYEARWRELIRAVRNETQAPLIYAANWSDYQRVPFWDALDAIGIQAYFPVADSATADEAVLRAGWARTMREIHEFSLQQDRHVMFTELGYNRSFAAAVRPWSNHTDGAEAEVVQEVCLRVALEAVESEPRVIGVFLWKWFPNPNPVGRDFQLATPRLKSAIRDAWR